MNGGWKKICAGVMTAILFINMNVSAVQEEHIQKDTAVREVNATVETTVIEETVPEDVITDENSSKEDLPESNISDEIVSDEIISDEIVSDEEEVLQQPDYNSGVQNAEKSDVQQDLKKQEETLAIPEETVKPAEEDISQPAQNVPNSVKSKILKGSMTCSRSGNVYVDRGITLSGNAEGGHGIVQYQYTEVYNGKTKIVQPYSEETDYIFKTTGPGIHTYYLDIKDEQGEKVRLSHVMKVTLQNEKILKGSISSSRTGNVYIDRSVILSAGKTGGYGTVEYQYTEVYNGKTKVVQPYSKEKNYSFKTTGPGIHTYYLDIKDEEGQKVRLSYNVTVTVHSDYRLKGSINSSRTGNVYIDRGVTLSAGKTGGYGKTKYQYTEVYNGKTKVVQPYSEEKNYSFKTTGPGIHTYYLDIKDEEGQKVRVSCNITVTVHPDYALKGSISSNRTGNVYIDRGITLSGRSSGGYGKTEYQYTEVYKGTTKVVKPYSEEKNYSFKTAGVGVHTYYLDIKDEQGQKVRISRNITVTAYSDFRLNGTLKSNISGYAKINDYLLLTASSSGGYGGKRWYRFRETSNGQNIQYTGFTENNACSFWIRSAGQHVYAVDIKDEQGQIVTASLTINVGKNGWFYEGGYKYYYKNGKRLEDVRSILGKQGSYLIKVNKQASCTTVYAKDGNNGYIIPVVSFACSPGAGTPIGTFNTLNKYRWWHLYGADGQFCTRITGHILFHSPPYSSFNNYTLWPAEYNRLGTWASQGCVRLRSGDAKWIYDNCSLGTTVVIYNSSTPGPFNKPVYAKIPLSQNWDPTDPYL